MRPRIIKTEEDYDAALARIDELMDAKSGTSEGDELDLLSHLVELYEETAHAIGLPTPIEAIRFRMEQQGLRQKDLCSCIGSSGKVSEVLSGKRTLSKSMITKLHEGLGIPLEVLLQAPGKDSTDESPLNDWARFPFREMSKRGWISLPSGKVPSSDAEARKLLKPFFEPVLSSIANKMAARQHVRSGSKLDPYALFAWRAKALLIAREEGTLPAYVSGTIDTRFMQQLVQLSYLRDGMRLAREFLAKNGIHFVLLRYLAKTFLDGAAMFTEAGRPVVTLTAKRDRVDNFWFTLCHELGHIALHLEEARADCFMDNLDEQDMDASEKDADRFAADSLIPAEVWRALSRSTYISTVKVQQTAAHLRVHPGVIAGRVRFERNNHKLFHKLVGQGEVRRIFDL